MKITIGFVLFKGKKSDEIVWEDGNLSGAPWIVQSVQSALDHFIDADHSIFLTPTGPILHGERLRIDPYAFYAFMQERFGKNGSVTFSGFPQYGSTKTQKEVPIY